MAIIDRVIDVTVQEDLDFKNFLGGVLEVEEDTKIYQTAVHLFKDKGTLKDFVTNYWTDKKENKLFDALCNYKEDYLKKNAVDYADFEQTIAVYGLSETCNRLFFCGLTENERSLFKKRYDRIEKVTPKDIYNALNTNIFYNPVRLVM